MRRLSYCHLPAALALCLATSAAQATDDEPRRSITVTASGQVAAVPDQARITSGVTSEAATAREALTQNSDAMKKVIAGLKGSGIDEKDVQTSSFRIDPRYTRPKEGEAAVIDGYRVGNEVQVLVRNLDKIGDILDQLVTLGANATSGLSFEVSQAETLRDEARKQAVANAKRRAELYAAAAGVELGEVIRIDEGGDMGPRPPLPMVRAMKAEAVPIERGTQMLEATVTVVWSLQ